MGDQYQTDFFFEPGIIKQESPPLIITDTMSTTASVPIPGRRNLDLSELRDFSLEIETSASPLPKDEQPDNILPLSDYQNILGNTMWVTQSDTFRMDEDDIFGVDKNDLIQGPTLAELNANCDTLLGDLNFDDFDLPGSYYVQPPKFTTPQVHVTNLSNNNTPSPQHIFQPSSCPQTGLGYYREEIPSSPYEPNSPKSTFSPTSQHSSTSSLLFTSTPPPSQPTVVRATSLQQKHSQLHELLSKRDGRVPVPGTSSGSGSSGGSSIRTGRGCVSRLSSSAPTHLGLDQIWQRREPRKHLCSTGSLAEAGSTSSLSTGGILSPEAQELSHDEGFDSDEEDSDRYEDLSDYSDDDGSKNSANKKERFFWQYNVQSKGPKGQRLVLKTKLEDPHVLNEVTDPVFSPNCAVRGIKHSGKARKGDGNDLTPNPRKLYNIGKELDKLGRIITDMTPVSELPFNVRPKTRKEKNKLASRACRLKKKAQHEANKLKLYGLEHEHKRLLTGISQVKQTLGAKFTEQNPEKQEDYTNHVEKCVKVATKVKIAGHSTEYVNKVLERIKAGLPEKIDDFN